MARKYVGIGEAADLLGVVPATLRRWEEQGKLVADAKVKPASVKQKVSNISILDRNV